MVDFIIRITKPDFAVGFYGALFESLMTIIWDVVPISYILYQNYMVYRRLSQRKIPAKSKGTDDRSDGQWYRETQLDLMRQEGGQQPGLITSYETSTNPEDVYDLTVE